jgi:GT2 family glycosyltransferase
MYKFDITHSSARFVNKEVFKKIGGFNEKITAGEDYDFQNRLNKDGYKMGFIDAEAIHLGEPTSFWKHIKKYYDYGRNFVFYRAENREESKKQLRFFRGVYFRNWRKFLRRPVLGASFFFYNFLKYVAGGLGYVWGRIRNRS